MSAPPERQTVGGCLLAAGATVAVLGGLGYATSHGFGPLALVAFVAVSLYLAHMDGRCDGPKAP